VNTLRAGAPLQAAGIFLVPVERVWLHRLSQGRVWAAGGREPVAVVIRDLRGVSALDMAGEPMALDALLADVEGLAAALDMPPSD